MVWENAGLMCFREHLSPCLHAPIYGWRYETSASSEPGGDLMLDLLCSKTNSSLGPVRCQKCLPVIENRVSLILSWSMVNARTKWDAMMYQNAQRRECDTSSHKDSAKRARWEFDLRSILSSAIVA